jgi:hypothetical protein
VSSAHQPPTIAEFANGHPHAPFRRGDCRVRPGPGRVGRPSRNRPPRASSATAATTTHIPGVGRCGVP